MNEPHVEVGEFLRGVRLHNVVDRARVAVNHGSTLGGMAACDFKIFDIVVAFVLHSKVGFHDAAETVCTPSEIKNDVRERSGLRVYALLLR